jgi:hypothetical protein
MSIIDRNTIDKLIKKARIKADDLKELLTLQRYLLKI